MFRFDEIHPYVHVYKGMMKNTKYSHKILKSSAESNKKNSYFGEWTDWFVFGKYTNMERHDAIINEVLDDEKIQEMRVYEEIVDVTHSAMGHYAGFYKIDLPESAFYTNPSLAYYYENVSVANWGNGRTMDYHTDFVLPEWYWPGEKFLITCTNYINDDYEGGEIEFLIDDKIIPYKPEAGDVLVFPSGSPLFPGKVPYYHGVRDITKGTKYLVRTYIKYISEATSEWVEGEKQYGEKEWPLIAQENARRTTSVSIDEETGVIRYPDYGYLFDK
jgi:hypothetical protein